MRNVRRLPLRSAVVPNAARPPVSPRRVERPALVLSSSPRLAPYRGAPSSSAVNQLSQAELSDLLNGIDFDEGLSAEFIVAPVGTSQKTSSPRIVRRSVSPRVGSGAPFLPDLFSPLQRPSTHVRAFSNSAAASKEERDSHDDLVAPPDAYDLDRMADRMFPSSKVRTIVLDASSDVEDGGSSDVEIVEPQMACASVAEPPASFTAATPYRTALASATLPTPDVPAPAASAPLKTGYFARPAGKPSAFAARVVRPEPKASKPFVVGKSAKAERQAHLKATLAPFSYKTWPSPPRLVYSIDEEEIASTLAAMEGPLAWDLEWPVANRKGIENRTSLAQICDSKTILLVHVSRMKSFSPSLLAVLNDPTRFKLGVQIKGDAKKLLRDFGVSITGLVELSDVARAIDTKKWAGRFGLVGLQDLAAEYTDRYLSKEADVRCGKWDAAKLSEEQKLYAANDVYVSLQIFLQLQSLVGETQDLTNFATNLLGTRLNSLLRFSSSTPSSDVSQPTKGAAGLVDVTNGPKLPTPRQIEAFRVFKEGLSIEAATESMSRIRKIQPLSAVWNLLGYLARLEHLPLEERLTFEDFRLLEIVESVGGPSKRIMLQEFEVLLDEARERERKRIGSSRLLNEV